MSDVTLMLTLSAAIWLSPFVAKLLRMPTAPTEIVLGSLLAFSGLIGPHEYFGLIANVGFLYLMFLAGLEVNLKQITSGSRTLLRQAIFFVLTLGGLAVGAGMALGLNPIVIVSLPLVSIGLLASLSKTYGKEAPWLQMSFVVGVLGEIVSIATLTVLDAASTVGFGIDLAKEIGYLVLFIFGIYLLYRLLHLLFWWYPEFKSILMPRLDTADQDVRLSMALFFILIAVMLMLHLELALGAFIAGVAISAFFHHEKHLEEKLSSLGFGLLVPIFFLHVGASFDLRMLLDSGIVLGALEIVGVMFAIRIVSAWHLRGVTTAKDALSLALALSMPLTLLVAVATIGYHAHTIDLPTYYMLILASLIEVIVAMALLKLLNTKRRQKLS
jgi:Kef-type K+ transport system membrane component KefB